MTEQNIKELQENLNERAEEIKQKACEIEEQVSSNVDELMNITAEKLDHAANKLQNTAKFFKDNNVESLKNDLTKMVKKYPGKSIAGAVALGFILRKIMFR